MGTLARKRASSMSLLIVAGGLGFSGCTYLTTGTAEFDLGIKERGVASWYGEYFHGLATASGTVYDMYALTAAHRSLPLGTTVSVVHVANGKQVRVKVTDRGPYKKGRIIDLSYGAADVLDMVQRGIALVQLEVVAPAGPAGQGLPPAGGLDRLSAPHHSLLAPGRHTPAAVAKVRPRPRPADFRRFPRVRRVADILQAEHTVYATTAGLTVV